MSLLKPSDVKRYGNDDTPTAGPEPVPAIALPGEVTFLVGKHGLDLEQLIPPLQQNHSYHIPSRGGWSLHELLEFLLNRTGPSKVWVTSWGITQDPLRRVMDLQQRGVITELNALFDSRVKLQCPEAYQLAMAGKARIRLAKNHSKVLVLINDAWGITVSTSANLTKNERLEYYVITTHRILAEYNSAWIGLELDGGQPFQDV